MEEEKEVVQCQSLDCDRVAKRTINNVDPITGGIIGVLHLCDMCLFKLNSTGEMPALKPVS